MEAHSGPPQAANQQLPFRGPRCFCTRTFGEPQSVDPKLKSSFSGCPARMLTSVAPRPPGRDCGTA
eukprot:15420056-Alexandrium_andersonii.AAC.1